MSPRPARRPEPSRGAQQIDTGTAELVRDRANDQGWTLLVNGVPSSYVDLHDPTRLVFEYVQWTASVVDILWPSDGPLRACHLGGGACSLARWLAATRPGSRQTVFEVDGALVDMVRDQLGVRSGRGLRIRVGEGRAGLTRLSSGSQDLVVRDAFTGDRVPPELRTTGFLTATARVLADDGLYVANLADRPPLMMARRELATARTVFRHCAVVAEPAQLRGRRSGNLLLLASDTPLAGDLLSRALAGGPAPARVLSGAAAGDFAGRAEPLLDPDGSSADGSSADAGSPAGDGSAPLRPA